MAKAYQAAAPWLAVTWQFVGTTVAGVGGGWWVDKWLGSKPWALAVGGLVGSALGFYFFIRGTNRLLEKKP